MALGITSLDPYAEAEGFKHALYLIEQVGWTGIGLINTVLAGFIAYSIGDKAALGAGFIGGAVASKYKCRFSWCGNRWFLSWLLSEMVEGKNQITRIILRRDAVSHLTVDRDHVCGDRYGALLSEPLAWINTSLD